MRLMIQGIQSIVYCFQGRNLIVEGRGRGKLLTSLQPGSRETRKELETRTHPSWSQPQCSTSSGQTPPPSNTLSYELMSRTVNAMSPVIQSPSPSPTSHHRRLWGHILDLNHNRRLFLVLSLLQWVVFTCYVLKGPDSKYFRLYRPEVKYLTLLL